MHLLALSRIIVVIINLLAVIATIGCESVALRMAGLGPKIEDSAIATAVKNDDREGVKNELQKGADINGHCDYGETILMKAIMLGNDDIAKLLIEKGADVNAKSKYLNHTALMGAAYVGDAQMVTLLINKGAEVNAESSSGPFSDIIYTSLMGAAEGASGLPEDVKIPVIKILLKNGADIEKAIVNLDKMAERNKNSTKTMGQQAYQRSYDAASLLRKFKTQKM